METGPASETLCSLVFRIPDVGQSPKTRQFYVFSGLEIYAALRANNLACAKDIRKVEIQSPENICKGFFLFSCSTFTAHLYLILTESPWIAMHLVSLGESFFTQVSLKSPAYSLSNEERILILLDIVD
jgi:hypothetical protein